MSEWWTYSLTDFLLFSPRTYYRLFGLYNEAVWPAHIAALALAAALLFLAIRGGPNAGRAVGAILAALWAWIAVAFHAERYATINWAATYFALAFALQAALLLWTAFKPSALQFAPQPFAIAIFAFAVVAQPFIGVALGRDWRQAEMFGLAPDPTSIATLALLAMAVRPPKHLFLIPLLWCAVTGLTLTTMETPDALMSPIAGALALLAAAWKTGVHETDRH
jgi:hypothetical protein